MSCTVPWPFKKWFDRRFKDICDEHDALYVKRVWRIKWMSDFLISTHFADRGYIGLAFAALVYNSTLGTLYWLWKKHMT